MKNKSHFFGIINSLRRSPLKLVGLGGLILILVLAGTLAFFLVFRNMDIFPRRTDNPFSRDLRNYDAALEAEIPELLSQRLDRLERRARGQEEWLSVLKRRRSLAQRDPRFLDQYQRSAQQALRTFPNSEAMLVTAADSIIHAPLNEERAGFLRDYAGRLVLPRFAPVSLSLYILAGDLSSPGQAAAIPGIERLLEAELSQELTELVMVDTVLLGIQRGEILETIIRIQRLLNTYPQSAALLALGGEFFYDHGYPLQGAELFSRLGDSHIGRTADALALAGEIPGARNIWIALGTTANMPDVQVRSLYNLAVTSPNEREASSWVERMIALPVTDQEIFGESIETFGIILYSRYQDALRSIAILEQGKDNPLIDLEILRRRMEIVPLNRISAEVWLLLGHHPDSEIIYQWGAWYFDRQRLFAETAQLMRVAARRQIHAPWLDLTRSLTLIREGRIDEGLRILESISSNDPYGDWRIPANIARVFESQGSVSTALTNYQTAARLSRNHRDSSQIQLRIGQCLEALGQYDESRRALEYALELNPDNIQAASLLRRSPNTQHLNF